MADYQFYKDFKKAVYNGWLKGFDILGRLRLDQNNGAPLPYSELPSIIKSAISEDGDGIFNSLDMNSNASVDPDGDATLNSLDINSNASIDSDGNATLNSITNNGYEEKNVKTLSSSPYNCTSNDSIFLVDVPAASIIYLPTPSSGRQLTIKDKSGDASSDNITINQNASEDIDGNSSYTINTDYGSVTLISDGTDWFVISEVQ